MENPTSLQENVSIVTFWLASYSNLRISKYLTVVRYLLTVLQTLAGKFYNIGDQTGYGEDHCQFVDSFLDGLTGTRMLAEQLQSRQGIWCPVLGHLTSFVVMRTHSFRVCVCVRVLQSIETWTSTLWRYWRKVSRDLRWLVWVWYTHTW